MRTSQKEKALHKMLTSMGRVLVAFSGGADSTYLLHAAVKALGRGNVLAVTAFSPVMTGDELRRAKSLARQTGARMKVVPGPEMHNSRFLKNDALRCYWCKRDRFKELKNMAADEDFEWVLEGSNVDDQSDYRPGMRAVEELGIRSPLLEAGLSKKEIRKLSRAAGLASWDTPAAACLASRLPYGTRIDAHLLERIASAEKILRKAGFSCVRVRHHGAVARIEVPAGELFHAASIRRASNSIARLKKLGWNYIALDLEGYATGSLNKDLTQDTLTAESGKNSPVNKQSEY